MSQPHILLITMDECRREALSCYGGLGVATPHIDRLAARGILCTDALTPSPVCLPARCAILSGLDPARTGMISNTVDRRFLPEAPNCFNLLKNAGYATAMIGKCHFTPTRYDRVTYGAPLPGDAIDAHLRSLGIDHLRLCDGKVTPFWYWDDYSRGLREAGLFEQVAFPGTPSDARLFSGPEEWHPDVWVGRQATACLAAHAADTPLFCWASFPGPHYPHDPPERYLERVAVEHLPLLGGRVGEFDGTGKALADSYRRPPGTPRRGGPEGGARDGGSSTYSRADWIAIQQHYLANVALIDDQVGALVTAAEQRFGENLVVILSADHGDLMGAHGLWGKGATCYNEVLNPPFIISGPDFAAGQRSEARISTLDILPTCCRLAGCAPPAICDGYALQDSLRDGGPSYRFASHAGLLAVDDGRWRLSRNQETDTIELYDRHNDPGEYDNLAHEPAAAAARTRLEHAALEHLLALALDRRQPPLVCTNNYFDEASE